MRRVPLLLKIAAGLAALFVVAAVLGTIALKKYLPPEKVRELITENSRKYLHREVRMQSLDLNAIKGLVIGGLEVSENPDFNAGTFAKADGFQLRVRLAPLLHGSVAVDRLAVSGLRLTIKKDEDGLFNFSDIAGSTGTSAGGTAAKGLPLVLDVRQLSISDGQVSYADAGTGDQLALSAISAQLTDLSLDDDTKVSLSLKADGHLSKRPVKASVEFLGSVNAAKLNLDKVSVAMKKAVVSTPQGSASLSGTIKGARSPEVDLTAEVTLSGASPVKAEVKGTITDISSQSPSASLAVKAHLPALKASDLKAFGLPADVPVPQSDVDTQFELAGELVTLKTLHFKTAAATLDASGTIDHIRATPAPALEVSAKADLPALASADLAFLKARGVKIPDGLSLPACKVDASVQLKADSAAIKSLHLAGQGATLDVSGIIDHLHTNPTPALDVSAKLDLAGLSSSDLAPLRALGAPVPDGLSLPAFKLEANAHLEGDGASIKSLHYATDGGTLDASGSVRGLRSGKPAPDLSVALKASAPKITPVVTALMKAYKIEVPPGLSSRSGEVDTQFHLTADAADLKSFHLVSQGSAIDASGRVQGLASGNYQPALDVAARLDVPEVTSDDLVFLKSYKIDVPAGMSLPPAKVDAKLHYTPDDVTVSELSFKNKYADAKASGAVHKMRSGHPQGTVNGSAILHMPALTAKDLAFLKMIPKLSVPDSVAWPATEADAQFVFGGSDISLPKLHVKNAILAIDGSGAVKNLATDPTISVSAKTSLPAFASADIAFVPGIPTDLKFPASTIELRNLAASRDAVSFDFLKLEAGKNSVEAKGLVKNLKSGAPLFKLTVICPGFVLEELTDLSPQTRQMGLKGIGRFKIFIAGEPTKGTAAYTGDMEVRGVRMDVQGFKLANFSGKGSFDDTLIDFPVKDGGIKGDIDDGHLEMDLSVKNYLKSPQIDIQDGSLTALDAGKLLAAKEASSKNKTEGAPAAIKPFGIKIWNAFTITKLTHPNATVDKISMQCDLSGITPDMKKLDGKAKFSTQGGHLLDVEKLAGHHVLFKLMALPLITMRALHLFPNLGDIAFNQLEGDYDITKGVVTVNKFLLDGDRLNVNVNEGALDFPNDQQHMDISVKAGVISKHMVSCGSISNPNTDCKSIVRKVIDSGEGMGKLPLNVIETGADQVEKALPK